MIEQVTSLGLKLIKSTTDKVKKSVDDLVEKRKISQEEGNSILEDVLSFANGKTKELEQLLAEIVEKIINKSGYIPYSEYEKLKRRVQILEKLYNQSAQSKNNEIERYQP